MRWDTTCDARGLDFIGMRSPTFSNLEVSRPLAILPDSGNPYIILTILKYIQPYFSNSFNFLPIDYFRWYDVDGQAHVFWNFHGGAKVEVFYVHGDEYFTRGGYDRVEEDIMWIDQMWGC